MVCLKENTNTCWKWGGRYVSKLHYQLNFGGDCILTATYIIKKLPTPNLEDKTPHEIILGKLPTYEHLWVLGCLVYAHNVLGRQDKFGERVIPCIFLGYPMGLKATSCMI